MKYTSVIFDLDGTLLNTLEDLAASTNYALSSCGMPVRTVDEVRNFVGNGIKMLMIRAVPDGESNPRFEEAFANFKKHYGENCRNVTRAYEGVPEMLAELKKQGIGTAIVSNKADFAVKELRDAFFPDIEVAIGEREGVSRKPAPDTVFTAVKELGTDIVSAVYVGDSDVDIMTAKNAGIPCISVCWGFRSREFLVEHGASQIASNTVELMKMLSD